MILREISHFTILKGKFKIIYGNLEMNTKNKLRIDKVISMILK